MTIIIFLYGLLIGSFLNVCIYRIPKGQSIAFPPSHCPSCNGALKWYNLIPVISYAVQGGKCASCKAKISLQYPTIELLNAALYVLAYIKYDLTLDFFFYAIICSILIIIAIIDLNEMIIPDILVICIVGVSIIYKAASYILYGQSPQLRDSIGGLGLSALVFIVIILVSRGGMGTGDVTLIGALGFVLGVKNIFITILLSFILGATISVLLLVTKIKGRKDPIPFGPFIILGFLMVIFWGAELSNWYMHLYYP